MLAEEIMVGDWSGLGERVKLADPLSWNEERHKALLSSFKDLLSSLSYRHHVLIAFPVPTHATHIHRFNGHSPDKPEVSDVVFPEKYYVENFLEIFHRGKISVPTHAIHTQRFNGHFPGKPEFPEIFHCGRISVAYFYILQYSVCMYILNIFNI